MRGRPGCSASETGFPIAAAPRSLNRASRKGTSCFFRHGDGGALPGFDKASIDDESRPSVGIRAGSPMGVSASPAAVGQLGRQNSSDVSFQSETAYPFLESILRSSRQSHRMSATMDSRARPRACRAPWNGGSAAVEWGR